MSELNQTQAQVETFEVKPLDEKYSANEGFVLIIRRGRNNGKKAASPNVMVEVPALTLPAIEDEPAGLTQAFQNAFDTAQAEMIKGLINDGATSLTSEAVSLGAVITFLNKTGGGRVTKDKIVAWFDLSNMAELLATAALTKNPNIDEATLNKVFAATKATLASLAAPGTDLGEATSNKLLALVKDAEPVGPVRNYLTSRLAPKPQLAIDLDDLI